MTADERDEDRHVQAEHDAGWHDEEAHDGCPACERDTDGDRQARLAAWPSDRTPPTPEQEREADAAFDAAGFR